MSTEFYCGLFLSHNTKDKAVVPAERLRKDGRVRDAVQNAIDFEQWARKQNCTAKLFVDGLNTRIT